MKNSLTLVAKVFSDTLIFFSAKIWVAFAIHIFFFQQKISNVFAIFQDRNFKVTLASSLVKF